MCDTMAIVRPAGVLFAKNSDRDPNEAQFLEWSPRRRHPKGATKTLASVAIPEAPETFATLVSRPFWMWGAEIGANEFGVAIGNEAVFTREPYRRVGLTGMELLRIALERGEDAERACQVIVTLLEEFGQGGDCGHENRSFTYHNSFIIADPRRAFVLETAGKRSAIEEIRGARSISNGLTIPGFAEPNADPLYGWACDCGPRQRRTQALADSATGVGDLFRALRDHGADHAPPTYSWINGGMSAPCMHAGGWLATSQTTASWVADLRPGEQTHWVTATSAPCASLFKPVRVFEPLDLGPTPTDAPDDRSLWWRHERLHRQAMRDPATLLARYADERDALEARWLPAPPAGADAFAEGDAHLEEWIARTAGAPLDTRPWGVRRYWARRGADL